MWLYVQTTVCHWEGKRGDLMKQHPTKMYTMLVIAILC